jgi:hypothetical protein
LPHRQTQVHAGKSDVAIFNSDIIQSAKLPVTCHLREGLADFCITVKQIDWVGERADLRIFGGVGYGLVVLAPEKIPPPPPCLYLH